VAIEAGMSPAIPVPDRLRAGAIALRPLRDADAARYAAAFVTDPDLGRLIGLPTDPDPEAARAAARATEAQAAGGTRLALAIVAADDDAFLGMLALNRFAWRHRRCELGYWLDARARGHGYATAAARLALDWAFPTLDLLRIEICANADNQASQAVAIRLGFTREARQIQRDLERGRRVDVIRFGLLREEWPAPGS
jgi:RimJ/RimL family protein N-acetyltransferase